MVDVVRADFAGDNVGCWMQIQVGRGPWASEVAGIVKIGQTMTMVLAIKDEENKFDMLVRNCVAHDGKRQPIELVDTHGCIVRSKLMSRFTKIKNFGSSASVRDKLLQNSLGIDPGTTNLILFSLPGTLLRPLPGIQVPRLDGGTFPVHHSNMQTQLSRTV